VYLSGTFGLQVPAGSVGAGLPFQEIVSSGPAFGGVLGVGAGAAVVPSWGFVPVLLLGCVLALASSGLCMRLRQPGRFLPGLPPRGVPASTT
ncbi:MAG: hypothetical protein ACJ73U_34720, partial [Actinophytocola sp.]